MKGAYHIMLLRCWQVFVGPSRSGQLQTQKLKSLLLRTQSLKVLPGKPGVGQYIALYTTVTARNVFLVHFYPSGPFTSNFSKTSPEFFLVLALANTDSSVGLQNRIGHPAHRCRKLMQVPVLRAREIGSKHVIVILDLCSDIVDIIWAVVWEIETCGIMTCGTNN